MVIHALDKNSVGEQTGEKTHSKPGNCENENESETLLSTTNTCSLCGNAKQKKIANTKAGNTHVET